MRHGIITILAAVLYGCGGGGGGESPNTDPVAGAVSISCAELHNEGATKECVENVAASFWPTAYAATTIVDAGVITRSTLVEATISVQNSTAEPFQGYYGMVFDGGCNGAETWEIVTPSMIPLIEPGGEWSATVGGRCGDMPLGERTLTATLYDADPATILDQVIVRFELVE